MITIHFVAVGLGTYNNGHNIIDIKYKMHLLFVEYDKINYDNIYNNKRKVPKCVKIATNNDSICYPYLFLSVRHYPTPMLPWIHSRSCTRFKKDGLRPA